MGIYAIRNTTWQEMRINFCHVELRVNGEFCFFGGDGFL